MKMSKNNVEGVIALIGLLVIFALFGYGWVMNIILLANTSFADHAGMLVLRAVGIFVAPIGAVLGYL